jgi:hypothetical protein
MEAMTKYTNLNPASQEGHIFLQLHFISQSAPDIQKKLQKREEGPQTPQQILVNTVFKVFNNRDKEAKQLKDKNTHTKYQMLASILQNQRSHTIPKTHPKNPENSSPEPAFDAETQCIGQKFSLTHAHQQSPVHSVDNGDTGRWTVCRKNSLFLLHGPNS